ncbi:MAG: 3-hydroxyacyl-ACP dehydratase FabZ [Alphaproteobacteria bacterium]|nr:3-hydroxyacyl-ACP dehydratase FabZ [Alphaproteobacteria bacterium]MBE8220146.1 3-hydroxyacyl-ACP dehydratase FabZ [Alphaproteobacteria bacterium]
MNKTIDGTSVTIDDIMEYLPHRYPFLLVDRVEEMNGEDSAVGIKNITASEPWFTGHFPTEPIFPGVLIIEAIAQTSAILVAHAKKQTGEHVKSNIVYFMAVDNMRFRHPAKPGDQLRIHVEKMKSRGFIYRFKGRVMAGDNLIAEGETMMMAVVEENK